MNGLLIDLGAAAAEAVTVVGVPAQNPTPPPGRGEEFGKASPIGLVVILLLGIVTILLIRNMSKRIKRLPKSFDEPADKPAERRDAGDTGAPRD